MELMTALAHDLAFHVTLRSGGAPGADTAFETGVAKAKGYMDIYLPWKGFNKNASPLYGVCAAALEMASRVHPAWNALVKDGSYPSAGQKLHARNCYQVLGKDLNRPSLFVVCWTPDGAETSASRQRTTGGTGTAIALGDRNGVPVFNLQKPGRGHDLLEFIRSRGLDAPRFEALLGPKPVAPVAPVAMEEAQAELF